MDIPLIIAASILGVFTAISFFIKSENKAVNNIVWGVVTLLTGSCLFYMLYLLLNGRFEYAYVFNHTNSGLPAIYKVSSLWAGQEGSFLLWAFILCICGFFIINKKQYSNKAVSIYSFITLAVTIMCIVSCPFIKALPVSADGKGLNAALQNFWMVLHPPLVFISYSLMAMLFSYAGYSEEKNCILHFSISRLMALCFVFLGLGIFTGSIWAYNALGWGGYWAWDPIENIAFIPWLMLLAFLHDKSKPGKFRLMLPFLLAVSGTFIVRSGILADLSLHAYAAGSLAVSVITAVCIVSVLLFILARHFRKKTKLKKTLNAGLIDIVMPKKIFVYATYAYAFLIFSATVFPLFTGIKTPLLFYDILSLIYVLSCSAFILSYNPKIFIKRFIYTIISATVLCSAFVFAFKTSEYLWVFVLWALIMPFCFCFINIFLEKEKFFYLYHCIFAFFIITIFASSAFIKEAFMLLDNIKDTVIVAGQTFDVSTLTQNAKIISAAFFDVIIDASKLTLTDKGLLLSYTIKPFMTFYIIFGFAACLMPLYKVFRRPYTKTSE